MTFSGPSRDWTATEVTDAPPVLVLGASGYVGARLTAWLLALGYRVRAAGRSEAHLRRRPWWGHAALEPRMVDVTDEAAVREACRGCQTVFFLVHSLAAGAHRFAALDREAALVVRRAAAGAGLEQIIYLGGLGTADADLSPHLRSRAEVAALLQAGATPATVLRAGIILGAGSGSFEIVRHLAARLPLMITPRWVRSRSEPIAISNVLGYLVACLQRPELAGGTFDIGGPETLTYEELFQQFCRVTGRRRRWIVPVPVLSPRLSSYWIGLVTPVPGWLARPLVLGLRSDVRCHEGQLRGLVAQALLTPAEAMARALSGDQQWQSTDLEYWRAHAEHSMAGDAAWSGGKAYRAWARQAGWE